MAKTHPHIYRLLDCSGCRLRAGVDRPLHAARLLFQSLTDPAEREQFIKAMQAKATNA